MEYNLRMWTRTLADADASCGGKALGLAKLIAAGLRVPDGFVIDDRAFRVATGDAVRVAEDEHPGASLSGTALRNATIEPDPGISLTLATSPPDGLGHTLEELARRIEQAELPANLVDEVTQRARVLGGPYAVRSSATIEDGEAGAAAGVFSSRTAVPIDELWPAIRSVWLSALTPLAAAYGRRRGAAISINVIVQRAVVGTPVIVYTRPPGVPDGNEIWIQRVGGLRKLARHDDSVLVQAERAIGARAGADIELVVPHSKLTPSELQALIGSEAPVMSKPTHANEVAGADIGEIKAPEIKPSAAASNSDMIDAQLRELLEHAWIVQARPIVHPVVQRAQPPPSSVLAGLRDGRRWTWDVTHNPDPLSPAQAGLVERIEREGAAVPWSARVCAGYLYTAANGERPHPPRPGSVDELRARVAEIESRLAAALGCASARDTTHDVSHRARDATRADDDNHRDTTLDDAASHHARDTDDAAISLTEAIDRYVAFFRIWAAELGPLIAVSRGSEPAIAGDRASAVEATLLAAARGEIDEAGVIDRLGVLAPAWDVAVPTFAERPGLLRDAIARTRIAVPYLETPRIQPRIVEQTRLQGRELDAQILEKTTRWLMDRPPAERGEYERTSGASGLSRTVEDTVVREAERTRDESPRARIPEQSLSGAAADLAERDDFWFAQAQWMVRRAIQRRAGELGIDANDAYWLPLDELATVEIDPVDAGRRASGARAAAARAAKWNMPISVGIDEVLERNVAGSAEKPGVALRGIGSGQRVSGRVVHFASLASAIVVGRGQVVVTRAVTPALAVIVVGCAAIVSETGGPLDHGAAMARELGIPCIVGCKDAWLSLADGMIVTIDGDAVTIDR